MLRDCMRKSRDKTIAERPHGRCEASDYLHDGCMNCGLSNGGFCCIVIARGDA